MEFNSLSVYWITTAIFGVLLISMWVLGLWIEGFKLKTFTIKNITIIGTLVALSVILSYVVNRNFLQILGTRITLGYFVNFLIGMVFGPLAGILAGIATDLIGTMIVGAAQWHIGFVFAKSMLGFLGSIVFVFKNNKHWVWLMVWSYAIGLFLVIFVVHPISFATVGGPSLAVAYSLTKFIVYPIELVLYPLLTYTSIRVIYILVKKDLNSKNKQWILRNDSVIF
ncbi:folate family ECF transporter S component [Mycoplasma mycoides subsp. mycoides]|uniref:ECF-type riboflavin transporter, S component family protein n=1 Tax=Mycoplasma mycoides subsp. mycoides TaxID=2103 RepID=A0AAE2JTG8_MYCMY|nr:folate family ECF transporter S component [Mycoplasma mycoides]ADK69897.1 putative membrane protein [Mycoplasma mycoides subsp. mycoides SC str. Gladysdale]AIZ55808.1 putative membrane protein [Mycoplasma mycoides subsp. mycoides]AME11116.1 putative membrane protein [Mycoplasma mycoides subsp. mycoides]AME12132.1 putative membrane protein [Mycoplasma mycoides subsp. mycoides]AME13174.1 putative membrane protein [Mycoplasma mycoides subsp. mycoides]